MQFDTYDASVDACVDAALGHLDIISAAEQNLETFIGSDSEFVELPWADVERRIQRVLAEPKKHSILNGLEELEEPYRFCEDLLLDLGDELRPYKHSLSTLRVGVTRMVSTIEEHSSRTHAKGFWDSLKRAWRSDDSIIYRSSLHMTKKDARIQDLLLELQTLLQPMLPISKCITRHYEQFATRFQEFKTELSAGGLHGSKLEYLGSPQPIGYHVAEYIAEHGRSINFKQLGNT